MQSSMMYLHVKKIGDESVDPVKDLWRSVCIVKPKGVLVLKKIQILCQKSPGESRYPELKCKHTAYIHKGTQSSAIYVL